MREREGDDLERERAAMMWESVEREREHLRCGGGRRVSVEIRWGEVTKMPLMPDGVYIDGMEEKGVNE